MVTLGGYLTSVRKGNGHEMGLDEVSGADFWHTRICTTSPIDLGRFQLDLADPEIVFFSVDPKMFSFSVDPKNLHPLGGGGWSGGCYKGYLSDDRKNGLLLHCCQHPSPYL